MPKNEALREDCIWLNSDIKIGGEPFFWEQAYNKGLYSIDQLYRDGKLLSAFELCTNYDLTLMQCNSLVTAILIELKRKYCNKVHESNSTDNLFVSSKDAYSRMSSQPFILAEKHKQWEQELGFAINYDNFMQGFKDLYVVTNIAKYRSFQYRLLTRAIITNVHLKHWGLTESNACYFCGEQKETYLHLFVTVRKWNQFGLDLNPLWKNNLLVTRYTLI